MHASELTSFANGPKRGSES